MSETRFVRAALPHDLPLLPAIERSAASLFADIPGLAHLAEGAVIGIDEHAEYLAENRLWVAESGESVAGFLAATELDSCFHIRELSVRRDAQGQGLGRALLGYAIDAARQRGYRNATLTTFSNVPWNAPFYARFGFVLLEPETAGDALREILTEEVAHGMPLGSRCAMRLSLD